MQEVDGATLSGQALVSDQAASRLAPSGFDPSRMAVIESRIGELEIEREEAETAMADIRAQLDVHHTDKTWRAKAKAALRYKGIDHQAILREIGTLKREQKTLAHSQQPFAHRFTELAKIMLPPETYGTIRDLALAGRGAQGDTP